MMWCTKHFKIIWKASIFEKTIAVLFIYLNVWMEEISIVSNQFWFFIAWECCTPLYLSRILHTIFEQKSDCLLLCKRNMNFLKTLIITEHRLYCGSNSFPFILVTHHMFSKLICQWRRGISGAVHNHCMGWSIIKGEGVLEFIFLSIFVLSWLKHRHYVHRISLPQSLLVVN